MPIEGVGINSAKSQNLNGISDVNKPERIENKQENKKDNSKLLYGSLAALAVIGVGYVVYRTIKGNASIKEAENATDNFINIIEYKPEPVPQEVKDKADKIVEVVRNAVGQMKTYADETASISEYIRAPFSLKGVGFANEVEQEVLPASQKVKDKADKIVEIVSDVVGQMKTYADETASIPEYIRAPYSISVKKMEGKGAAQEFGFITDGLAYNANGQLFSGERELVGWQGRKMLTKYKDGKVVERTYTASESNPLLEINRRYDESVEGIKMIDTATVQKNLRHSVKFEVLEKETKFAPELEEIIPKAKFDRPFDAEFYSQFHSESNGIVTKWTLHNDRDIVVFGTGDSGRGPKKMSLYYKGSFVRDFIDTPLGNIKGFRNKNLDQLSIHTNMGYQELKVRSMKELGIVSHKGRTLDDLGRDLEKRFLNNQ